MTSKEREAAALRYVRREHDRNEERKAARAQLRQQHKLAELEKLAAALRPNQTPRRVPRHTRIRGESK